MSLEFSEISAVPGDETTLQVRAIPDSLCGLSIVDQSVLIMKPGNTLTADNVRQFNFIYFNIVPMSVLLSYPCNLAIGLPLP